MKRFLTILLLPFLITSCIPLSIAPDLGDGKVLNAKSFKRQLPKRYAYAFEDPKNADEFYHYIRSRYKTTPDTAEDNVPVEIAGTTYYMSFYETEKSTKTINLIPIAIDAALTTEYEEPILYDLYASRQGRWYVLITLTDEDFNDALRPENLDKEFLVDYLKSLRTDYLNTNDYHQFVLKD